MPIARETDSDVCCCGGEGSASLDLEDPLLSIDNKARVCGSCASLSRSSCTDKEANRVTSHSE